MIVKNESAVITRLLESVAPWIDSYCICDTGSTDDTIDIIRAFFQDHDISGVIICEKFQDFGYNRTHALESCAGIKNADYLLLLDADMVFWVSPEITKSQFKSIVSSNDTHYVFQGSPTFDYKNIRIIRNRIDASYYGVTHEYLDIPGRVSNHVFHKTDVFIKDIGDGGSKTDKFERDIKLLMAGLEKKPNNSRYTFYLANSYRDSGQYDNAIEQYKKRVEKGGWIEETWSSYYNIGICYKRKGEPEKALYWWMQAYQFYPDRLENIYEIIRHHRERGDNNLANMFYQAIKPILETKRGKPLDHLFLKRDVYDYLIDYEYTIFGYYCGADREEIVDTSMRVLLNGSVPDSIRKTLLSNYKFVCPILDTLKTTDLSGITTVICNDIPKVDGFVSSTPCMLSLSNDKILVNIRYVNYSIDKDGKYVNNGTSIESKNLLSKYVKQYTNNESFEKVSEAWIQSDPTNDGFYIGLEDVRLFHNNDGTIAYNATRILPSRDIVIETGVLDVESGAAKDINILESPYRKSVEKNWVFSSPGTMIYEWSPLVVGEILENRLSNLREIETPFKGLRGSTNGVLHGDEIWFICHLVSYEKTRYYYHMFVVLEKDTHQVKRWSKLFTFEGKPVEYTLGFAFIHDQLVIGYSLMDRETKYMSIPKTNIDNMFIKLENI
jgi:tetratricopeptide (TPR) repeat protein